MHSDKDGVVLEPFNGGGTTIIPPPDTPRDMFISDHVAYIVGYPDGHVRPAQYITRAEATTVFFRLLQDDLHASYWTQQNPYKDVKMQNWYNNAISVMHNLGIVQGYTDSSFRPNVPITRAEMATIAARFARKMPVASSVNNVAFNDIAGHWAEQDILYAARLGWINGYSGTTFNPNDYITRAEFMTLVNRMLERIPESEDDLLPGMIRWPDNTNASAWYYLAIQEATNTHAPEFKTGTVVPGLTFPFEQWKNMLAMRDWTKLEKEWSMVYSRNDSWHNVDTR
jgi:hypothetical protein